MDDIIYEQDYTRYERTAETERAEAIFNQAIDGGFFKAFADAMDKIPKIIVEKDKENYEYLLDRLDAVAKRKHGRIRGIVDYHKWESHIEVFLPFLGFESPEDLELMKEIAEKAHAVTVSPYEDGVRLYIMNNYFEELMTDAHQDYLKFDAIMQDEKLVSMLGVPQLSEEEQYYADRLNAVLDRFEEETDYDRTTVFQAVLAKVMKEDEENQTLERIVVIAETLAEAIGADIYEIAPAVPYTKADLNWMDKKSRSSVEMNDPSSRPAIGSKRDNMADYDTVFVGFPIWWYVAPTIINTFLESYDLTGKTIVPFATSGGSDMGKTNEKLLPSCAGAKLIEGKVFKSNVTKAEMNKWAEMLSI